MGFSFLFYKKKKKNSNSGGFEEGMVHVYSVTDKDGKLVSGFISFQ